MNGDDQVNCQKSVGPPGPTVSGNEHSATCSVVSILLVFLILSCAFPSFSLRMILILSAVRNLLSHNVTN